MKEELKIDLQTAIRLNKDCPEWFKPILQETFGKKLKKDIIDHIKTFEDAYAEADEATKKEFDVQIHPNLSDHIMARLKLILIASVLRGDWKPDFENRSQQKWYPWFEYSAGSGFDFSNSNYHYDNARACVGSRLCFPTKELSDLFGKQFIELHREHLL